MCANGTSRTEAAIPAASHGPGEFGRDWWTFVKRSPRIEFDSVCGAMKRIEQGLSMTIYIYLCGCNLHRFFFLIGLKCSNMFVGKAFLSVVSSDFSGNPSVSKWQLVFFFHFFFCRTLDSEHQCLGDHGRPSCAHQPFSDILGVLWHHYGISNAPKMCLPGTICRSIFAPLLCDIPSGERLHFAMENHHAINGKIHYFDWAISHCYVSSLVHQRVLFCNLFFLGVLENCGFSH